MDLQLNCITPWGGIPIDKEGPPSTRASITKQDCDMSVPTNDANDGFVWEIDPCRPCCKEKRESERERCISMLKLEVGR